MEAQAVPHRGHEPAETSEEAGRGWVVPPHVAPLPASVGVDESAGQQETQEIAAFLAENSVGRREQEQEQEQEEEAGARSSFSRMWSELMEKAQQKKVRFKKDLCNSGAPSEPEAEQEVSVLVQLIVHDGAFPPRRIPVHRETGKQQSYSASMADILQNFRDDLEALTADVDAQGLSMKPYEEALWSPGIGSHGRKGFAAWSADEKCFLVEKRSKGGAEEEEEGEGTPRDTPGKREDRDEICARAGASGSDKSLSSKKQKTGKSQRRTRAGSVGGGDADADSSKAVPSDEHEARVMERIKAMQRSFLEQMEQFRAKCDEAGASLQSKKQDLEKAETQRKQAHKRFVELRRQVEDIKKGAADLEDKFRAALGGPQAPLAGPSPFSKMQDVHGELISLLASPGGDFLLPREIERRSREVEEEQRRVHACEADVAAAQARYDTILSASGAWA